MNRNLTILRFYICLIYNLSIKKPPFSKRLRKQMKSIQKLMYSDFEIIKVIGFGAYGKVQLAKFKNKFYALKSIEKKKLAKQSKQYQVFVQREILMKLKHQGIIGLYTCFQDKSNLYFALEYCQGGDLKSYISEHFSELTEQLRKFYILEIVKTIEYFQSVKVVHRDIKPQNILINSFGHLKIADFGTVQFDNCDLISDKFKQSVAKQKKLSLYLEPTIHQKYIGEQKNNTKSEKEQQLDKMQRTQSSESANSDDNHNITFEDFPNVNKRRKATFVGTCYYLSPELLQAEECGFASDIWALGCVIYELYYGVTPFDAQSQYQIFEKIKQAQLQFPKNFTINEEAIDLIKQLLKKNPEDRLGCNSRPGLMFEDLLKHKYFEAYQEYLQNNNIFTTKVPELYCQYDDISQYSEIITKFSKTKTLSPKKYSGLLANNNMKHNLIHEGIVEKRTFINYNKYYLALLGDLTLMRVKVEEPEKIRIIQIQKNLPIYSQPAELLDKETFKLIAKEKVYKFKCLQAAKWVQIINSVYLEFNSHTMAERNQINQWRNYQQNKSYDLNLNQRQTEFLYLPQIIKNGLSKSEKLNQKMLYKMPLYQIKEPL